MGGVVKCEIIDETELSTSYIVLRWNEKSNWFVQYDCDNFELNGEQYIVKNCIFDVFKQQSEHDEITKQTYESVEMTTFDNLINMDMLIEMDAKFDAIIKHFGITV